MRAVALIIIALLLQSCGDMLPSERFAACNGANTACQWRDVRTHQVISLPKSLQQEGKQMTVHGQNIVYPW